MIITPETSHINDVEDIAPPIKAVTIPLAVDGRHYMHDGFSIYVAWSRFGTESRDTRRVLQAIAQAVAVHLETLPPFDPDDPPRLMVVDGPDPRD